MHIDELYSKFLASTGVSTDSRSIKEGQLFFALKGENFNGNTYAKEVLRKGAGCAIIDETIYKQENTILVDDVLTTLQILANHHRNKLNIPVIGLTGTNGKTTTKELMVAVLSQKYNVHATKGNFNNHIGVPLTLLAADADAELMIIEMGANQLLDIKELCEIAEPDYGLITNIGQAHLEGFGSFEGVITAKTELYKYIASHGKVIFYNEDDPLLIKHLPQDIKAIPYGSALTFDTQGLYLSYTHKATQQSYTSKLSGYYNKDNIRTATGVGVYFQVPEEKIYQSIADYLPNMNRSELQEIGPYTLLMDAYNANPTSMKAAIESFAGLDINKEKVLILGDMKELGKDDIMLHGEVLDFIEAYEWRHVWLVGPAFKEACSGRNTYEYSRYEDVDSLLEDTTDLKSKLDNNTIALIKGSRSIKLERIKAALE